MKNLDRSAFGSQLESEIGAWQQEGLILPEQAVALRERYEMQARGQVMAHRLGPVATLLSVVGAIVVAAGVLLFVSTRWAVLPPSVKTGIVFGGTALAGEIGYLLRGRIGMVRTGSSVLLLSAILFQIGLFVLAQIMRVSLQNPLLLVAGAVGIVSLAYAIRSSPLLVAGLLDLLAAMGWALEQRYDALPQEFIVPCAFVLAGIGLYAAGRAPWVRGDGARFSGVYGALGLLSVLMPLYFMTDGGIWQDVHSYGARVLTVPTWFPLVVGLAIVAGLSTLVGHRDAVDTLLVGILATLTGLIGVAAYRPAWGIYLVGFNLLYFALVIMVCIKGSMANNAWAVNFGLVFLAFGLLARYYDYFAGVLDRAVFLVVGGVVLLGVATSLEWARRRILTGPSRSVIEALEV